MASARRSMAVVWLFRLVLTCLPGMARGADSIHAAPMAPGGMVAGLLSALEGVAVALANLFA